MKVTIIPTVTGDFGTVTKGLFKWLEDLEISYFQVLQSLKWSFSDCTKTSGDHPNYFIIKNGQNTEKNPGDLRGLAVTQTPVKDHQLMLMWNTLKV